jgi:hypothetical protein
MAWGPPPHQTVFAPIPRRSSCGHGSERFRVSLYWWHWASGTWHSGKPSSETVCWALLIATKRYLSATQRFSALLSAILLSATQHRFILIMDFCGHCAIGDLASHWRIHFLSPRPALSFRGTSWPGVWFVHHIGTVKCNCHPENPKPEIYSEIFLFFMLLLLKAPI